MKKALVLTLAFALGLGVAAFANAPLSGSWCADISINPQSPTFTAFNTTITVDYTVGGWTFESLTKFSLTGWTKQEFTADGVLGAFTIGSDLKFNPSTAAFTSWDTTGSVSIAGVSFDGEFLLTDVASGWAFGASGGAGDLSIGADVYFNSYRDDWGVLHTQSDSYCFCFTSVDFDVSFPFGCIDLVEVSLGFSHAGFDGVTFSVSGIELPGISWLVFDADLTFSQGTGVGKSLTLTPKLNLGDFSCFTLYTALVSAGGESCTTDGALSITGINIYAIGVSFDPAGVTFSDISIFDVSKYIANVDPYWNDAYWEEISISTEADSCCGGGFSFALDTYFSCTSEALFDWAETDVSITYGLGSNFDVSMGLNVTDAGFVEWDLGFCVTW